jgi:flagella basal body P-ring formation protein FlgA
MKFVINLMLILMTTSSQAQVSLRFQPHITDNARLIGDLLIIYPDEQQLARTPLDSSPRANSLIDKRQIIHWLETKTATLDYQWKGKNTAWVEPASQTTGQELINKAQSALTEQLNHYQYTSFEISPKTIPVKGAFSLNDLHVEIKDRYPPLKQISVRLNDKKHSVLIWFKVKAYQKILVAKHELKRRTLISKDDFILKNEDIAGLKSKPYSQLPKQLWLKKTIKRHAILSESDVNTRPQVIKGQAVHVNIMSQGIAINTEAIAEHDGYLGQSISTLSISPGRTQQL